MTRIRMTRILLAVVSAVGIAAASGHLLLQAAPLPGSRVPHPQPAPSQRQSAAAPAASAGRALLDGYCVSCHNDRLETAGLMFDQLDLTEVGEHGEVWEKVVGKLRAGAMPPPGARRRPEQVSVDGFVAWLEERLDRAAADNTPARPAGRASSEPV